MFVVNKFRASVWVAVCHLVKFISTWLKANGVVIMSHQKDEAFWAYGHKAQDMFIDQYGEPFDGQLNYLIVIPSKGMIHANKRALLFIHESVHVYRHMRGWYDKKNLWYEELLAYAATFPMEALLLDWKFIFDLPRRYWWSVNLNMD